MICFPSRLPRLVLALALAAPWLPASLRAQPAAQPAAPASTALDRSGKRQHGKASIYSRRFAGKTMADGTPMNPNANIAASKTLPLGTKAQVTNLRNGRSTEVEIRDRGPYVKGRIVDLSPKAASEVGATHEGVVPVEVAPITVPQADGSLKLGAAAKSDEKATR